MRLAALSLLLCLAAAAQNSSGVYKTYISGNLAVTEKYTISTGGATRAEADLIAKNGTQHVGTILDRGQPKSFSLSVAGAVQISAEFAGGDVHSKVGAAERDSPTHATAILENLLWHHCLLLLQDRSTAQTIPVYLPTQAVQPI